MSKSKPDYRTHAESLSKDVTELLGQVVIKYTTALLEEMHSQLQTKDAEIDKIKLALTKHIAWSCCNQSLSKDEAEKLIAEFNTIEEQSK